MRVPVAVVLACLCASAGCAASDRTHAPPASEAPWPPPLPPPPLPPRCEERQAKWALGKIATDELLERARQDARARSARIIRENEIITLEYVASRLNLKVDDLGIVRTVICG